MNVNSSLWSDIKEDQQQLVNAGLKNTTISFSNQDLTGLGTAAGSSGNEFLLLVDLVSFASLFSLFTEVGGLFGDRPTVAGFLTGENGGFFG